MRVTASALALLERCPGQAVLPHYGRTSAAAKDGTREHAELVPALLAGRLPDTPRGRWLARQGLPRYSRGEVAYALDLRSMTARVLGRGEYARDYRDAKSEELCGTIDLEGDDETAELKCGALPVAHPRVNRQLQFGAVARWLARGERVRLRLIQVYASGRGWQAEHEPDHGTLARWARELAAVAASVARAQAADDPRPLLRRGEHCGLCDAREECPAIDDVDGRDGDADRYLGAQAVYQVARTRLDRARALLAGREHVAEDGRVVRPTTVWRRRIDAEAAVAAIPALASYASRSLPVAALSEYAATRADLGRYQSERVRALEEQLERAGALSYEPTHGYEEQ